MHKTLRTIIALIGIIVAAVVIGSYENVLGGTLTLVLFVALVPISFLIVTAALSDHGTDHQEVNSPKDKGAQNDKTSGTSV